MYITLWFATGLIATVLVIFSQIRGGVDFKASEVGPALLAILMGPLTVLCILIYYADNDNKDKDVVLIKGRTKKEENGPNS